MEQPTSAFDHYERGRVLKQSHMFDEALDEFRQAATDPQYAGKALVQMALCLRAMERYDEAAAAFRQALELATFSSEETTHILYLLGQTLESLGRYAQALEAYGWARKEDPGFQDVAHRIKHLLSGGRGPLPPYHQDDQSWVEAMRRRGQQLTPQILSLLEQVWKSLGAMRRGWGPIEGAEEKVPVSETRATRVDIRNSRPREAVCRRQGTARETNVSMSALRSDCTATFHREVR